MFFLFIVPRAYSLRMVEIVESTTDPGAPAGAASAVAEPQRDRRAAGVEACLIQAVLDDRLHRVRTDGRQNGHTRALPTDVRDHLIGPPRVRELDDPDEQSQQDRENESELGE
jgi:hypothetical protein